MRVHFISIGGSVMHQLAIALQKKGYAVTGSDDEIFEPSSTALKVTGLFPNKLGWFEENIHENLDAILLGMHARADNPELLKAQALGLPVFSFPEYMYHESRLKTRVVVGGSHGKTTTTSMIMHALKEGGREFDFLVGARLPGFEHSVAITDAPVVICEGDEYPASALEKRPKFHFLFPHIAVLTGIAWDHINVFPTFENYLEQFRIFLDKIEPQGTLIYNQLDPVLKDLVESHPRQDIERIPYGIPPHRVVGKTTLVEIEGRETPLKVFGDHNLMNIQAAWLVCSKLGMVPAAFAHAISSFTGAAKRLEILAENGDRIVFRDFAHAPSKVKATVQAVQQRFPGQPIAAILELHTYSSLNAAFMPHYHGSLEGAGAACVFYSPHAMEIKKMPPLPAEQILAGFSKEELFVCTRKEDLQAWISKIMPLHKTLLLMSSGSFDGMDVHQVASRWVNFSG